MNDVDQELKDVLELFSKRWRLALAEYINNPDDRAIDELEARATQEALDRLKEIIADETTTLLTKRKDQA